MDLWVGFGVGVPLGAFIMWNALYQWFKKPLVDSTVAVKKATDAMVQSNELIKAQRELIHTLQQHQEENKPFHLN